MEKFDLIAMGEMLIDMTPKSYEDGTQGHIAHAGGAPCNVAVMASKMGAKTACVSKVGSDSFGKLLLETLKQNQVATDFVQVDITRPTTLAFVHLEADGERTFSFYRNDTADVSLVLNERDIELLESSKCVCYGSVGFSKSPLRESLIHAVESLSQKGLFMIYDPNYRAPLWKSENEALEWIKKGLQYANLLKVSEEEAFFITGTHDLESALKALLQLGIEWVAITRGAKGVLIGFGEVRIAVDAYPVKNVLDTTGAGDAFLGTFIAALLEAEAIVKKGNRWMLSPSSHEVLIRCAQLANAASAICISGYGAIPSFGSRQDVLGFTG